MLELSEHLGPIDAAEALHYAENAETLATALARAGPRAEALYLKGRSAEYLLDYPRALGAYADALVAFETADDMSGVAKVLRSLGYLHNTLGDFPSSLDHLFRALALDEHAPDDAGRAATLRYIGMVHCKSGDVSTGLDYYRQSLAIAAADRHPAERARIIEQVFRALPLEVDRLGARPRARQRGRERLRVLRVVQRLRPVDGAEVLGELEHERQALARRGRRLQQRRELGDDRVAAIHECARRSCQAGATSTRQS